MGTLLVPSYAVYAKIGVHVREIALALLPEEAVSVACERLGPV